MPTPIPTFTGAPGTAVYSYAHEDLTLLVTLELEGSEGTLEVQNESRRDLGAPDVYVLDAVDGHEIQGEVVASAPVPAGGAATFDVTFEGVGVEDIGLLMLQFGSELYGAFVRIG